MIKKLLLLSWLVFGSFYALQALEGEWTRPSCFDFPPSQYFPELLASEYTESYELDLQINMINASSDPLKTNMLKTILLSELKKMEMHFSIFLKRDTRILKYYETHENKENICLESTRRQVERYKRLLSELQQAERFTK
jgi:hypothetical protein